MTTGSVKSLQNVRDDGGSLLARGRKTIRRVNMGRLLSKSSRFLRPRTRKKFAQVPNFGILYKVADDVRRLRSIWEIPVQGT
jgi:hypothetical protein